MLKKYNGIYSFQLKILIFFLCIYLLHFEACYEACQTCYNESRDLNDMKCINCKNENFSILNGTTNCVPNSYYNDYYITYIDENTTILNPCSELDQTCYECDPELETELYGPLKVGICLSCIPGYKYSEQINWCTKNILYLKIIKNDFENCKRKENGTFHFQYCNKYITEEDVYYELAFHKDIICPDNAPIFNSYLNSCVEMDCPEEGFSNGKCIIYKQKYKDRKFFISWFNGINGNGVNYLSVNSDKS